MSDEEEDAEETVEFGKTFTAPMDMIQYGRDELFEIRIHPLSLMRPSNLPALDCVKAYHRE